MIRKMILPIPLKSMNVKKHKYLYYLIAIAILLSSCGKENQQIDYNTGVLASQEYVQSQQMMNLLLNTYFKSITDSLLIVDHHTEIDGAIVTYSETPEERLVIYYPDWGCEDDCGHIRAGTIIAMPSTGFYDSLDVIRFIFEDFQYDRDDVFVNGMTVTNLGRMDGLNYSYKIVATSVQRVYADTTGMTQFAMDQTFVMYKDQASIFHSMDDHFRIHGVINGTSSAGDAYSASINDQEYILDQFSCRWAKQGPATVSIESETYGAFILFPGADTCFNKYAVDIDGNPFYYPFD
jgi:hypothetical protein